MSDKTQTVERPNGAGGVPDVTAGVGSERLIAVNMGPHHPSTHGVLRLGLVLDGEKIVRCVPDIGYLHTGVEKLSEHHNWTQNITHYCRLDYLCPMHNELAYCLAVEKLIGPELKIPRRADYIRVLMSELTRIIGHMVWLGTHALDIGAMSVFFYCFREREKVLDLYEEIGGQRMMTSYIRIGGVAYDTPPGFLDHVMDFVESFEKDALNTFHSLLTENPIWLRRTQGIGVIGPKEALEWGLTGPVLRGSGVAYDVRRAFPYCRYEEFEFDIPVGEKGDTYDRYLVRMEELRQSCRIIRQAVERLRKMPRGDNYARHPKFTPPGRVNINSSMEELIHHFKYWTEGIRPPKGEAYAAVESNKGEMGYYVKSEGGPKPFRVKIRAPAFVHLQALPRLVKGHLIADVVTVIGSIDLVLGEIDR